MKSSAEGLPPPAGALDWTSVLEAEYEALYGANAFAHDVPTDRHVRLEALHRRLHQRRPAALCLSGGGIRRATYGLGVLQALARMGPRTRLTWRTPPS
jgi:hypothetical protein